MAFFDKVGATISSKGRDVAKKAKDLAETTSLNGQINSQEEVITHTFQEIGKAYYEKYGADAANVFPDQCAAITTAYAEIARLKNEIRAIKGIELCASCGAEIPSGSAFCPGCGGKMPEKEVIIDAVVKDSCPGCGIELEDQAAFCPSCGTKLSKMEAAVEQIEDKEQ